MRLIRLTRPDDSPVWINAAMVTRISPVESKTLIDLGGVSQFVKEAPDDVVNRLRLIAE